MPDPVILVQIIALPMRKLTAADRARLDRPVDKDPREHIYCTIPDIPDSPLQPLQIRAYYGKYYRDGAQAAAQDEGLTWKQWLEVDVAINLSIYHPIITMILSHLNETQRRLFFKLMEV